MNEILTQWENSMRFNRKSEKTIAAYLRDINIFLDWIKQSKQINEVSIENIKSIKKKDLVDFMGYLMQPKVGKDGKQRDGNSNSTIIRRGNAVKAFYRFLEDDLELISIEENATLKWKLPSIEKKERGFLTEEEAQTLIESVGNRNKVRNTAILMLFLNTGLRRQELINLNLDDLRGDRLKILGKGKKERVVFVADECLEVIDKWLEIRAKIKPLSNALFVSEQGNRMSENAVYNFIKSCMKKIGREDCSPHSCRHSFAYLALANDNNIKELQEVLGHANLNTTGLYGHVTDSQKQKLAKSVSKFKVKLDD